MFRTVMLASLVLSVITLEGTRATSGPLYPGAHYAAGDGPRSLAIGNLNGDQVPDLAVANGNSDNVSVLLGVGDGTFAAAMHYAAGDWPQSVAMEAFLFDCVEQALLIE